MRKTKIFSQEIFENQVIGPNVIQVIQEIFENQVILPDWGVTNLLIPKVAYPKMITQF